MPMESSPLPVSFKPSINEVIIGRGLRTWNHCGNERMRELIKQKLLGYSTAKSRAEKSSILGSIVQVFRKESLEVGGFVKQDLRTKRWYTVEDLSARATVAQAFRDALSKRYRSSKHSKRERRWNKKSVTLEAASDPVSATRDEPENVMPSSTTFNLSDSHQPKHSIPLRGMLGDALESVDETTRDEDLTMSLFLASFENGVANGWTEDPFEPTPISPFVETSWGYDLSHHTFSKAILEVPSTFSLNDLCFRQEI